MLLRLDPEILILLIPALVFSLCVHEFAHGIIAYNLGDDTAYRQGRLTLNPLKHLDPVGSLMLLFIGFGYAKPVPVNPYNLSNPRKDMIKVAIAGPLSNLLLALIGTFLKFSIYYFFTFAANETTGTFIYIFIQINIFLAIFNLLPIHPLDGGQIFGNIISKYNSDLAQKLNIYGPNILMGLILIGLISGFSIIGLFIEPIYLLIKNLFDLFVKLLFSFFI